MRVGERFELGDVDGWSTFGYDVLSSLIYYCAYFDTP